MIFRHLLLTICAVLTLSILSAQNMSIGSSNPSTATLSITPPDDAGRNLIFRSASDVDVFEVRTDGNSWALANAANGANFLAAVIGQGTVVQTDFFASSIGIGSATPSVAALSITPPDDGTGRNIIFRNADDDDIFEMRTDDNSWALANAANGANFLAAVIGQGTFVQTDFFVTGAKNFIMDHPLDPANKSLRHSCIESPEVLNIYSGSVTLDENGKATVELPDYFEAINKDFRYQLTAIGAAAPTLHIAKEVEANRFEIAGGLEGMKVSWEVAGVRNDPYFKDNPYQAVQEKSIEDKGYYYYPQGYGASEDKMIHSAKH